MTCTALRHKMKSFKWVLLSIEVEIFYFEPDNPTFKKYNSVEMLVDYMVLDEQITLLWHHRHDLESLLAK